MNKIFLILCISAALCAGCSASKRSELKSDFSHAASQAGSDAKNFGKGVVRGAKNVYSGSKEAASDFVDELGEMGDEIKDDFY